MTRSPGERTAIENKQTAAQLPQREYNIDCNLSNLGKEFITQVSKFCTCVHRPSVQSRDPLQVLKMDSIIAYNSSCGHSPIGIKLPNMKGKIKI